MTERLVSLGIFSASPGNLNTGLHCDVSQNHKPDYVQKGTQTRPPSIQFFSESNGICCRTKGTGPSIPIPVIQALVTCMIYTLLCVFQ